MPVIAAGRSTRARARSATPADRPLRRVVLLVTSPRLPAGLLTAAAWDLVRAHPVLAGAESEQTAALRSAGADVTVVAE